MLLFPLVRTRTCAMLSSRPAAGPSTAEEPRPVDQPAAAFWLLRKEAWTSVGGFDEEFHPAWFEDVDFCKRLKLHGWEVLYLPQPCAWHKGGASLEHLSYKRFIKQYYRNQLVYWRKHHSVTLPLIWVPVKLGANGVEQIIEITLTEEEQAALKKSADAVEELKELVKKLV